MQKDEGVCRPDQESFYIGYTIAYLWRVFSEFIKDVISCILLLEMVAFGGISCILTANCVYYHWLAVYQSAAGAALPPVSG